jgi:hypothetical protein
MVSRTWQPVPNSRRAPAVRPASLRRRLPPFALQARYSDALSPTRRRAAYAVVRGGWLGPPERVHLPATAALRRTRKEQIV